MSARQWNYGEEGNLQAYNRSDPPEYDLASVDVPIAVYYGDQDALVNQHDIGELIEALPRAVGHLGSD